MTLLGRSAPAIIDQSDEGHPGVVGLVGLFRGVFRIGVRKLEAEPCEVDVGRSPRERIPYLIDVMSGMVIVGMSMGQGSSDMPMRMAFGMMMVVLTRSFVSMADAGRRKAANQHQG